MPTIAYFDCSSGISGNMVLGALIDAGLEPERLKAELARLPIAGYDLQVEQVTRHGLHATHVQVDISDHHPHRHLHHIEDIIAGSDLPAQVKQRGLTIFRRLAQAEAKVHGAPVESIHFHEVGAVDAIVDVMGAAIGLWVLDVKQAYASPVHVGRGTVECAHGVLPVPAPATLELLRDVPTYGRDVDAELVTPTGAAILTGVVETFGDAPPMRVQQVGYGAGTRELSIPNLLRLSIGESGDDAAAYERDTVTVIETNIDDMNPQWYEHLTARLFEAGALDVTLAPIYMKRGRPATQLSVLVAKEGMPHVLDVLFGESTTIGVRAYAVQRWKLAREIISVETAYGTVAVKVSRRGTAVMNVLPEYRDCRRIATEQGVPLKEVYQAAMEAAQAEVSSYPG